MNENNNINNEINDATLKDIEQENNNNESFEGFEAENESVNLEPMEDEANPMEDEARAMENEPNPIEDEPRAIEDEPRAIEDEPSPKTGKPKKYSYRKSIAVGLTGVILCGASLGFFLGVGLNTSDSILKTGSEVVSGNFSFDSDAVNSEATQAQPVNLVADEKSISSTISSVENSVVNISIKTQTVNFFNQVSESEGAGSGIIYKIDGDTVYIVTNNHVIDGASTVTISVTGTEQISAKLVGKDSTADLAIISVSKADMEKAGISNITAAKFNADSAEVGESVIAIGNALGRGKTATLGIISAKNKEINVDGKTFNFIQTDAAINPGNSGGALVNTSGEVIGINTAKMSTSSVEGTGYAIPASTVKEVAEQLIASGSVKKAYLGISGATITDDFRYMYGINVQGVYISNVETDSAAQAAGIQVSDIITAVDGTSVTSINELSKIISSHKPDDQIKISIVRNGTTKMDLNVTLADANSNF